MKLAAVAPPADLYDWRLAAVLSADDKEAKIGFADKSEGTMPLAELKWARFAEGGKVVGKAIAKASDAVQPGDVVIVALTPANAEGEAYPEGTYALRQIPEVSGALVAMDPHTGRVHALTGGWSYTQSEFNRATQALRQPGSSFKPIVYLAALDSGFTPSTVILDAPITLAPGARPAGLVTGKLWRRFPGSDHHARRHREIPQPDDCPRRPGDRHAEGGGIRHEARRRRPYGSCSIDGSRRRRNHAAAHGHRLFDDRQWRQEDHRHLHRPHPGPARPHPVPP